MHRRNEVFGRAVTMPEHTRARSLHGLSAESPDAAIVFTTDGDDAQWPANRPMAAALESGTFSAGDYTHSPAPHHQTSYVSPQRASFGSSLSPRSLSHDMLCTAPPREERGGGGEGRANFSSATPFDRAQYARHTAAHGHGGHQVFGRSGKPPPPATTSTAESLESSSLSVSTPSALASEPSWLQRSQRQVSFVPTAEEQANLNMTTDAIERRGVWEREHEKNPSAAAPALTRPSTEDPVFNVQGHTVRAGGKIPQPPEEYVFRNVLVTETSTTERSISFAPLIAPGVVGIMAAPRPSPFSGQQAAAINFEAAPYLSPSKHMENIVNYLNSCRYKPMALGPQAIPRSPALSDGAAASSAATNAYTNRRLYTPTS